MGFCLPLAQGEHRFQEHSWRPNFLTLPPLFLTLYPLRLGLKERKKGKSISKMDLRFPGMSLAGVRAGRYLAARGCRLFSLTAPPLTDASEGCAVVGAGVQPYL